MYNKNQMTTVSEQTIMYKIVDKAGNEVENGFNSFGDALARIRQLNRLGMKNVFVVDAKTKVIYKRSSKNRYAPKWVSGTHQWFPRYKKANDAIIVLSFSYLSIDLNEEQQGILLKEVEEKFLKEKRGYVRKFRSVPVRYINCDRIFSGFIINFSHGGCFIKTDDPLFVGEEILMDIGLDCCNKAIRIKGIVAHVNRLGIGIKYKKIITVNSEV